MEAIHSVAQRIQEIRAKVGAPPVPGEFQAMLDARLSADAELTAQAAVDDPHAHEVAHDHDHAVAPAPFGAQATASMTMGAMLGIAPAPAIRTPQGILNAAELDRYLLAHDIQANNGRLPEDDLVPVSGGWKGRNARLLAPAATAWEEMRAAAAASGVELLAIDTYRSWASQNRAHQAFLRGEKFANVLPAGRSEHGNGLAVDLTNGSLLGRNDTEWRWMVDNAANYGWYPISNETWHWEFRGLGA